MRLAFSPLLAADWPEVRRVYAEGIATGLATFEAEPPRLWEEFIGARIAAGCLVARDARGTLAGWAALLPVSPRPVYRGVAEASVYVGAGHRGRRVGDQLLAELVRVSENLGFWTLQSATFPQNLASIALQRRHGFHIVGIRERIGRMARGPRAGQWGDTLLLERRSRTVGV